MGKPERSICAYLIGIYLFFIIFISTALNKKNYASLFSSYEIPENLLNIITTVLFVLGIVIMVQIIRYNKIFFYISSGWLILSIIRSIYLVIAVNKIYLKIAIVISIINILILTFLLNKNNLRKCDEFAEYYKTRKEENKLREKLK